MGYWSGAEDRKSRTKSWDGQSEDESKTRWCRAGFEELELDCGTRDKGIESWRARDERAHPAAQSERGKFRVTKDFVTPALRMR
jgi:hypothetical protein